MWCDALIHRTGDLVSRNAFVTMESHPRFGVEMARDSFEPRMSFNHGRTKPVVVEKIKRRAALLCPFCNDEVHPIRKFAEAYGVLPKMR